MSQLKRIARMKQSLAAGDPAPFLDFLRNSATADDLQAVREQKLLTRVRDDNDLKQLVASYKDAANRHLTEDASRRAAMYVDFVRLANGMFSAFNEQSARMFPEFARLSLLDVLDIAEDGISEAQEHLHKVFTPQFETLGDETNVAAVANRNEHTLQTISARATDMVFAVARVINEVARHVRHDHRCCRDKHALRLARESFEKLYNIAGWWNSLEYALDKVSFGEWFVSSIEQGPPPTVTFDEVDSLLTQARHLGLRRNLVHRRFHLGTEDRFLRDFLREAGRRVMPLAAMHYEHRFPGIEFTTEDMSIVEERLRNFLDDLDADDDLLAAANPNSVAHYHAGFLLRCFREMGTAAINKMNKRRQRVVNRPSISPTAVVASIQAGTQYEIAFRSALEEHTVKLPLRNHLELTERPFIRMEDGGIFSIDVRRYD